MDQVDAKVLRAKWASIRSRYAIAAADDDLERHQRWLDRHRAAWAEDVKLYERRLDGKSRTRDFKRLAWGLLLIGPITCLALLRLIAWLVSFVLKLRFDIVSGTQALVRFTRKHLVSHLSKHLRATKNYNKRHHFGRIAGLDGLLCTAQPAPSALTIKSESGLLKVRLVVGSFAAVIVGFLATAPTFDTHKAVETPQDILQDSEPAKPLPPAASHQSKNVDRLAPDPISGFAVVAAAPEAERVSLVGTTITEIISLTRPLPHTLEQAEAAIEAAEVTLPARKPTAKIRVKSKRSPAKQKNRLTLWEQLPWLR
jgi:hypothetical protein